ncbi:LysM peptidoglycan-binding domain-containing protein [Paenibacillus humicola]|uniref:LysM peptidoglycan-binding domain-containing protein n=1 Tax=Paenibacillus humicola TaxID=3110540 RepID=UPI00237B8B3A|nr:LysM peptidoglycan-binding domain-containing protein [Paenibacillus humicola]
MSKIILAAAAFALVLGVVGYTIFKIQPSGSKPSLSGNAPLAGGADAPAANDAAGASSTKPVEPGTDADGVSSGSTATPDASSTSAAGTTTGSSASAGGSAAAGSNSGSAADSDQAPASDDSSKPDSNGGQVSSAESGQTVKLPATYVVRKGDTLSSISMRFYHSKAYVDLIAQQNHMAFINDMSVGDTLKIPALPAGGSVPDKRQDEPDYSKVTLPAAYMVQPGDTLFHISQLFYRSGDYADLLAKQNKLDKTKGLKAGSSLVIPALPDSKPEGGQNGGAGEQTAVQTHTVQKGETLYSISRQYYGSDKYANTIAEYNHLADGDAVKAGDVLKIPPVPAS